MTPRIRGPVTIAHVTATDYSFHYLLRNQLIANRAAGYRVLAISERGASADELAAIGVPHRRVPITRQITPVRDLVALARLVQVFRRERPAIVHTHTIKAGLLGQLAAAIARVPLRVHTIHGLYVTASLPRRVSVWLERATHAFCHRSFSQSIEDVGVAIAERICAPGRIEWIGNGIELARFDPARVSPARRAEIRASLGYGPDDLVVGTVGRLVAEKGYLELFAAAALLRHDCPALRFLCVGPFEPDKPDAIAPEVPADLGVAELAQLVGHRADVEDLYAAMDLFVLPSHREGFPRAPMEAAASGLPCVVSDIRGCRQTVEHEVTGVIVPRGEPLALAAAIRRLAEDPLTRRRFGIAARAKAAAEFDERVVFERVLGGYDRLRAQAAPVRRHALTIDLEDWHQSYRRARTGRFGPASESVVACTHRILDLLDDTGARATFFVVGALAADHPALIRMIARRGHEVASHSYTHRLLSELSPAELAADLARSKHQLEALTGERVRGFRAPEFSIGAGYYAVFELLARLGFAYDSSVVPGPGMRYAIAGASQAPFPIATPGGRIVEFPIATTRVLGRRIPLGGTALRFLGGAAITRAVHALGACATLYVHPYEFSDAWLTPARLGLQDLRHTYRLLLHNVRTAQVPARVAELLRGFQFQPLRDHHAELFDAASHDAGPVLPRAVSDAAR